MKNYCQYILLGFAFVLSFVACDKMEIESPVDSSPSIEAEAHEVRLVLSDGATRAHFEANEGNTRASVTDDGRFLWQSGDRFRLYAHKSDGSNAFPADSYIDFSYWVNTTSAGRSFFTGTIHGDMNDGSYTYYAVYPHSTIVDGTTATFTLRAEQDGTYSRYDFMVARSTAANSAAASGNALQAIRDDDRDTPEPMNDITLSFSHKLHAMRFEIPSQGVLSSGIRRVHILFSEAVAGDVVVNMATDEVSYTNMTNKITVDFGTGNEKHSGDVFWVMTLPQESFSRAVDIRFEDSNGNFTTRKLVSFPSSQQYTAGRLTPLRINVPSSMVGYTTIEATTKDTQLGERVTHLHLEVPVGYYFTDYNTKYSAPKDINEVHTFELFDDMVDDTFRAAPLTLTYESVHALIPTTTNFVAGLQVGKTNNYSWTTPWLFFEDFNNVVNFSSNDGYSGDFVTGSMDAYSFLSGWTGGRIGGGGEENKSVRLACRRETSARYPARLDSPIMSHLKADASVKVKVSYNYGMHQQGGGVWTTYVGQTCYEGCTTDRSALKSGDDTGTFKSEFFIDADDNRNNGNYDTVTYSRSFEIADCTSGTRISWRTQTESNAGLNNNTCWLYIDNVRVSIDSSVDDK